MQAALGASPIDIHRRPSLADHSFRYITDLKVGGCADGIVEMHALILFIMDGQNRDTHKFRELAGEECNLD
jgi:hypothetical protein